MSPATSVYTRTTTQLRIFALTTVVVILVIFIIYLISLSGFR